MRLLVVEDDPGLQDVLRRGLTESGHVVDVAGDGLTAEAWAAGNGAYDAVVLDVNLPGQDGLTVLRSLRASNVATPVLLLTSRDTPQDVITGLDAGANDYLRKPFVFGELEARLRSIVRRATAESLDARLCVGEIEFDLRSRRVRRGTREIDLTARESAFLEFFMRNAERLVTRRMIEDALFDRESETTSNVIDVYVSRLRAKLTRAGEPQVLHTVRGGGYRFGAR